MGEQMFTMKNVVTCLEGAVNHNNFYSIKLLFMSLHVSASTGHFQVKYNSHLFKSYYAYNRSVCRLYSLLFHMQPPKIKKKNNEVVGRPSVVSNDLVQSVSQKMFECISEV
jgi:hypothetical protein